MANNSLLSCSDVAGIGATTPGYLTFHLLAWGCLVSLFILLEVFVELFVPAPNVTLTHPFSISFLALTAFFFSTSPATNNGTTPLAALVGTFNILTMMAANLVGFVITCGDLGTFMPFILIRGGCVKYHRFWVRLDIHRGGG
jgi:hypothetical protein